MAAKLILTVTEKRTYTIDPLQAAEVLRLLQAVNDGDEDAKAQLDEILESADSEESPEILAAEVKGRRRK